MGKGAPAPCPPSPSCSPLHGGLAPLQPTRRSFRSPNLKLPRARFCEVASGEGILIVSTVAAQRRALFVVALTLILGVSGHITQGLGGGRIRRRQMRRLRQGLRLSRRSRRAGRGAEAMQGQLHRHSHEARLRRVRGRHGQSMRRPRLCRKTQNIQLVNAATKKCDPIRRQGMRDPRLGPRREGATITLSPKAAQAQIDVRFLSSDAAACRIDASSLRSMS